MKKRSGQAARTVLSAGVVICAIYACKGLETPQEAKPTVAPVRTTCGLPREQLAAEVMTFTETTQPKISGQDVGVSNIWDRELPDNQGKIKTRLSAHLSIFNPDTKQTRGENVFAGSVLSLGSDRYCVISVEYGKDAPGTIALQKITTPALSDSTTQQKSQGGPVVIPPQETDSLPNVLSRTDIDTYTGKEVVVKGRYQAIPIPTKGKSQDEPGRPKDCAIVVLADGTGVYVEAYNDPAFKRPKDELLRYDGKQVHVRGLLHRRMPSQGQSLVAPCISQSRVTEEENPSKEVSIEGIAQNAKAGAVIVQENGEVIYVLGLESWASDFVGKKVEAQGTMERKRIFPEVQVDKDGAISQGMEGIPLVLNAKSYKLVLEVAH